MLIRDFIKTVTYALLVGLLIYSVLCFALPLYKYLIISLIAAGFFLTLSVIVYILGERALNNSRSGAFLSVVVINTFIKLMACFLFVFVYVKISEPPDKLFLIPFFIYYIVFMVAETHFLSTQARKSKVN